MPYQKHILLEQTPRCSKFNTEGSKNILQLIIDYFRIVFTTIRKTFCLETCNKKYQSQRKVNDLSVLSRTSLLHPQTFIYKPLNLTSIDLQINLFQNTDIQTRSNPQEGNLTRIHHHQTPHTHFLPRHPPFLCKSLVIANKLGTKQTHPKFTVYHLNKEPSKVLIIWKYFSKWYKFYLWFEIVLYHFKS